LLTTRLKGAFLLLALAQAAHSLEEYFTRLWEVWAPAQFLTGLVSSTNPVLGFAVINVSLVALGFACYWFAVRPGHSSARGWIWFWVLLESVNGIGHALWAVTSGVYRPGLLTALPFFILVPVLVRELFRTPAQA
jgi:hypothetical protein